MSQILELDVRMTDNSHHLIDLKEQSVKFSVEYSPIGELDPLQIVLDYISNQIQYKTGSYLDVTGNFSKSKDRSKWSVENEDEEYDHEGFARIFVSQITYVMIVYKKEDSE